jgi:hypothetical protein
MNLRDPYDAFEAAVIAILTALAVGSLWLIAIAYMVIVRLSGGSLMP